MQDPPKSTDELEGEAAPVERTAPVKRTAPDIEAVLGGQTGIGEDIESTLGGQTGIGEEAGHEEQDEESSTFLFGFAYRLGRAARFITGGPRWLATKTGGAASKVKSRRKKRVKVV